MKMATIGGGSPFCEKCKTMIWEMFTTTVVVAVINEHNEVALIRQTHADTVRYLCVYDIMRIGETAEGAVIREVKEELGLNVKSLTYIQSFSENEKEVLALGFVAHVDNAEFSLSNDVEDAEWVRLDNSLDILYEGSFGKKLVKTILDKVVIP